jgi:hypothetical protein
MVHATSRKERLSPFGFWTMFCPMPTSESSSMPLRNVLMISITPNISGATRRDSTTLVPKRRPTDPP